MDDDSAQGGAARVLVVDDQQENLALVQEILADEGFVVELAAGGAEALEAVRRSPPDCIVLDVMMPGIDGFSVCRQLKERRSTHFIPIVMLTALTESEHRVRALELGADDFLTKPVIAAEVVARVRSLARIKRLRDELDSSDTIIRSLVEALESTDPQSVGHSRRVTSTALAIARILRLPGGAVEAIGTGAVLHDVGKIGLPLDSLRELPGLAAPEVAVFRRHPELGEQLLAPFAGFREARRIVRRHHERRDGSGFPDGLRGAELDLESEIVALANHYDERRAAGASHHQVISSLLEEARSGRFDRDLVEALRLALPGAEGDPGEWQDLLPPPPAPPGGRVVFAAPDRPSVRELLAALEPVGIEVERVSSADALRRAVESRRPDLAIIDAELDGALESSLTPAVGGARHPAPLPILLLVQPYDVPPSPQPPAVDDLVVLPIGTVEFLARVRSLLRLRRYVADLEERHAVIVALANAIEAKDPYTRGHSERVGVLAARIAARLGFSETDCHLLRVAGLVHDIGKIGVPHRVLLKREPLEAGELAAVREHSSLGERICRPLRTMQNVLPLIRSHHERLDGSGYPDGLQGHDVPVGARVLGLADAFDALTSARPYRRTFTPAEALGLLARECAAGQWDPQVLAALEHEVSTADRGRMDPR